MKRRAIKVLSALSLVLCVATCMLWARSFWWTDMYSWSSRNNTHQISIVSSNGVMAYVEEIYPVYLPPAPPSFRGFQSSPTDREPFHWKYLGFDFSSLHDVRGRKYVFRFVPDWSICILALLMPAASFWLRHRQRRKTMRRLYLYLRLRPARHAGSLPRMWDEPRKHDIARS